jgi:hypothetical protein
LAESASFSVQRGRWKVICVRLSISILFVNFPFKIEIWTYGLQFSACIWKTKQILDVRKCHVSSMQICYLNKNKFEVQEVHYKITNKVYVERQSPKMPNSMGRRRKEGGEWLSECVCEKEKEKERERGELYNWDLKIASQRGGDWCGHLGPCSRSARYLSLAFIKKIQSVCCNSCILP